MGMTENDLGGVFVNQVENCLNFERPNFLVGDSYYVITIYKQYLAQVDPLQCHILNFPDPRTHYYRFLDLFST